MIRIEVANLYDAKSASDHLLRDDKVTACVYISPDVKGFLIMDSEAIRFEIAPVELAYSPERRRTSRVNIHAAVLNRVEPS